MKFGSLFAGIGGIDLGLERAGMECAWQVEIDDYCTRVLEKHWPDVPRYGDIRGLTPPPVDLIAGGFPCQPHSVAGKRRGAEDNRNLWPEFIRVIRELKPRYVLAENVPGIITTYLDTVLSDLEGEGYTCPPLNLPAVAFDAPHRRERIFVVGYSEGAEGGGIQQSGLASNPGAGGQFVADAYATGLSERQTYAEGPSQKTAEHERDTTARGGWWSIEPDVGRVAHGVPSRVDRLRGLGNAVVPQVAEWIGRRIMEFDGN